MLAGLQVAANTTSRDRLTDRGLCEALRLIFWRLLLVMELLRLRGRRRKPID